MDKKTMMEKLAREAYEKGAFTGVWLYAEHGEIVSKGAVGFRDAADTLPVTEDSVFNLASISKQFTAAAILLLRRRGLLDLEDEITRFYPEMPYKGVTIRHLLSHTGGLPDFERWAKKTVKEENCVPKHGIILRFLRESGAPPAFAPGEQYAYGNTGYCLLSELVQLLSGLPFGDFLKREIFEPAGMTSTRLGRPTEGEDKRGALACGLVLDDGSYVPPEDSAFDYMVPLFDRLQGCSNVYSNVFDLLAWDRALREGCVLTEEEQRLMATPVILSSGQLVRDEDSGECCGLGWSIADDPALGRSVGHDGSWDGYSGWYERFLDADRVLTFLCCRFPIDVRAFSGFWDGMKAVARDRTPEPVRAIEDLASKDADPSGWEALCGTYERDGSRIEVSMSENALYAAVRYENGYGYTSRLLPLGEKSFGLKVDMGELCFEPDGLRFWGQTYRKL